MEDGCLSTVRPCALDLTTQENCHMKIQNFCPPSFFVARIAPQSLISFGSDGFGRISVHFSRHLLVSAFVLSILADI
jgi:hypothetical protein